MYSEGQSLSNDMTGFETEDIDPNSQVRIRILADYELGVDFVTKKLYIPT